MFVIREMIHILPVNDLKEHEESVHCHCQPKVDWVDEIVIHNAYDKREIVEQAKSILKG